MFNINKISNVGALATLMIAFIPSITLAGIIGQQTDTSQQISFTSGLSTCVNLPHSAGKIGNLTMYFGNNTGFSGASWGAEVLFFSASNCGGSLTQLSVYSDRNTPLTDGSTYTYQYANGFDSGSDSYSGANSLLEGLIRYGGYPCGGFCNPYVRGNNSNYEAFILEDQAQITFYNNFTTNTTLDGNKTYKISGNLIIEPGITLTLEPNTVIKFDTSTSSSLTVDGTLNANVATSSDGSVFFTSLKDDLEGGDTNGDASSTTPTAGDWGGIKIESGGTANIAYAVVRYGGAGSAPMIYNNGGTLSIASSTIAYSSGEGIKTSAGTTTIQSSDIGFNSFGLYVDGGTASIAATSTIHNNSSYGVYNTTGSYVSAEGNYWGDSSGPYDSSGNPSGTGDSVSGLVDYYPWVGTSTLHYVIDLNCHVNGYCGSVPNGSGLLLLDASATPYVAETNAATSTWNTLAGGVTITAATSTSPDTAIYQTSASDLAWKGNTSIGIPGSIWLNTYYLSLDTSAEIQNTITHELGHAIGLDHSYTGNVMYFAQSSQTSLGPQDVSDFNFVW